LLQLCEIILLLFSGIVISGISYALYGSGLRQVTITSRAKKTEKN